MGSNWEVVKREGDPGGIPFIGPQVATYTVQDEDSGETEEVVVWQGTDDEEMDQLGDKISRGDFYQK